MVTNTDKTIGKTNLLTFRFGRHLALFKFNKLTKIFLKGTIKYYLFLKLHKNLTENNSFDFFNKRFESKPFVKL